MEDEEKYTEWTDKRLAVKVWHLAKEIEHIALDLEVVVNALLEKYDK